MTLYSIQPGTRITIQNANRYSTVTVPDYLSFDKAQLVGYEGDQLHFRFQNTNFYANKEDVIRL